VLIPETDLAGYGASEFGEVMATLNRITSGLGIIRSKTTLAVKSLALIGNASAHESRGGDPYPSRGVFDKETRRKPLAFAADAGYGN
jgi:hypothetical protein